MPPVGSSRLEQAGGWRSIPQWAVHPHQNDLNTACITLASLGFVKPLLASSKHISSAADSRFDWKASASRSTEASRCSANRKLPLLLPHELEQVDIPDFEMVADVWNLRPFWVA